MGGSQGRAAPRRLKELRNAVDGGNGTALERAGHALKGSALGVGAWRLSVLAQCAEAHGREGRPERARSLVVELETELAAVETHLPGSF